MPLTIDANLPDDVIEVTIPEETFRVVNCEGGELTPERMIQLFSAILGMEAQGYSAQIPVNELLAKAEDEKTDNILAQVAHRFIAYLTFR